MMSVIRGSWRCAGACLFLVFCSVGERSSGQTPGPFRLDVVMTNGSARLALQARPNKEIRLEGSPDLRTWQTDWLLLLTNGQPAIYRTNLAPGVHRFWRAVEPADPGEVRLRIDGFAPTTALVGEALSITGGGFDPKSVGVTVGGAEATVVSVTDSRIVVTIPPGAGSGEVRVTTPSGSAAATSLLTLAREIPVELRLPVGVPAGSFRLVSLGVGAVRAAGASGGLRVRVDQPGLVVAVAEPATAGKPSFSAWVNAGATSVVVSARSTAESLVLLHPYFAGSDAGVVGALRKIASTNASMALFAAAFEGRANQVGNPLEQPEVLAAYVEAVISLGREAGVRALALQRQRRSGKSRSLQWNPAVGVYLEDVESRFIEVVRNGNFHTFEAYPFNPVDWIVVIEEVDVDRAFPLGRLDFDKLHQRASTFGDPPVLLPATSRPRQFTLVGPDHFFSRFGILGYAAKSLSSRIADGLVPREAVSLPGEDALYVAYAIGPAFGPPVDDAFARTHFPEARIGVLTLNLVAVVLDVLSAMFDYGVLEEFGKRPEFIAKLVTEAAKGAATIQSPEDFIRLSMDLTAFTVKELVTEVIDSGGKAVLEGALLTASKTLTVVLKALDIIGGVGQVFERASGLLRTTTVEEILVIHGEPFRSEVVSVTPDHGSPWDVVTVVLRGAEFQRFHPKHAVHLLNAGLVLELEVLSAVGDRTRTELRVRIPDSAAELANGRYSLEVIAEGRRGQAPFDLVPVPTVRYLSPPSGWSVEGPPASAFRQSQVTLSGVGFGPGDRFLFPSGVEAREKFGTKGDVTLTVPSGVRTGPIRIVRESGAVGESPVFTVLGPPKILSMDPTEGPPGTRIRLEVLNLPGPFWFDPSSVRLLWQGVDRSFTAKFDGRNVAFTLPDSRGVGDVTIRTPAGSDSRPFNVYTPSGTGGFIRVGGESPVELGNALAYVAGKAVPPPDDGDVRVVPETGQVLRLDPPYEDLDFIAGGVGADRADTVTVTGVARGSFEMSGNDDTLTAEIEGSLYVSGSGNRIDVHVRDRGLHGLTVSGSWNIIKVHSDGHSGDGIRIVGGHHNRIEIGNVSSNLGNGITITGGASHNVLVSRPERSFPFRPNALLRANRGHGIAVLDAGTNNFFSAGDTGFGLFRIEDSGLDGVRFEGARLALNQIVGVTIVSNQGNGLVVGGGAFGSSVQGTFEGNRGRGVSIRAGSAETLVTGISSGNGSDGVELVGANTNTGLEISSVRNRGHGYVLSRDETGAPTGTRIDGGAVSNTLHGIQIFGVEDSRGVVRAGSLFRNGGSGLSLEAGASGWNVTAANCSQNESGVQLTGINTRSNLLSLGVEFSRAAGIRIERAMDNVLTGESDNNQGPGVVLDGAIGNLVSVAATLNRGAGILFTNGASANLLADVTLARNTNGVVIAGGSASNRLLRLTFRANTDHGLILTDPGTRLNSIEASLFDRTSREGIRIENGASRNVIGGLAPAGQPAGIIIQDESIVAGIRVSGLGTTNNEIMGVSIVTVAADASNQAGIVVENGAAETLIGSAERQGFGDVYLARCRDGILIRSNATGTRVLNTRMFAIRQSGVRVDDSFAVGIGGNPDPGPVPAGPTPDWAGNQFDRCTIGVTLQNLPLDPFVTVSGNRFLTNTTGILITNVVGLGTTIFGNTFIKQYSDGIQVRNSRSVRIWNNQILNSGSYGINLMDRTSLCWVQNNAIQGNFQGVVVDGTGCLYNRIQGPGITRSAFQGISLYQGGNRQIPAPVITDITANAVFGTADAPDGSRIEIFSDPDDEGERQLGSATVQSGKFRFPIVLDLPAVGVAFNLTATVTDPQGNTSPFGRVRGSTAPSLSRIVLSGMYEGQADLVLLERGLLPPVRLTSDPGNDTEPALNPYGTNIVFVSDRDGRRRLYQMPPLAGAPAARFDLAAGAYDEYEPAWHPYGAHLAFVSERDGNPEVYVRTMASGVLRRLTSDAGADRWPTFAPDGLNLVFISDRSGKPRLTRVGLDGTRLSSLPVEASLLSRPAWSPDGRTIAFVEALDTGSRIREVLTDGTGLRTLVADGPRCLDPAWTRGGDSLLYVSDRSGVLELHVLRPTAASGVRLTLGTGDLRGPSVRFY